MLNLNLVKNILIIGISAGVITTALVQKIKIYAPTSKCIPLISFIVSMIVGTLFALNFSNIGIIGSLWVGLFTFIGADALYKTFEDKVFTPFANMDNTINIERDD